MKFAEYKSKNKYLYYTYKIDIFTLLEVNIVKLVKFLKEKLYLENILKRNHSKIIIKILDINILEDFKNIIPQKFFI